MNTQPNTVDTPTGKTGGRILAAVLRQVFRVGTRTRRYRKNVDLHIDMIEAIENAVQLPGYFGPEKTAVFRTAWGAVMSYNKHVRGYRIDGMLAQHINALSAYQFAALLGRMVDAGVSTTGDGERFFDDMARDLQSARVAPTPKAAQPTASAETENTMTATPDWTRQFVTATTTTDDNQTIVRYASWRLVIDTSFAQRYPSTTEADVAIVADDQGHDCACLGCASVHGSPCPDNSTNLVCMGTDLADEADMVNEAVRLVAEQGFRVDGPWVPDANGRLTAPLVPVILDPNCAAYESDAAETMAGLVKPEWMSELAERATRMAVDLNARGQDVCPTCLSFRENGSCLNCTMVAERAAAMV